MDPGARTFVSSKIADVMDVTYADLRQAIGVHTNLVSATSRGPTAMDIGAIEDSSPRLPEAPATDNGGAGLMNGSSNLWTLDESG